MNVRKQSEDLFEGAWNLKLPPAQKMVLMTVARGVDEHGLFRHGLKYIQQETEYSQSEAKRTVKALRLSGMLKQEVAQRGRIPAVYSINLAAGVLKLSVQIDLITPVLTGQNEPITAPLTGQNEPIDYTQRGQIDPMSVLSGQKETVQIDPMPDLTGQDEPINPSTGQIDPMSAGQIDPITRSAAGGTESLITITSQESLNTGEEKDSARSEKPRNRWYDNINSVWGYTGALNGETAKMLQGKSSLRGFKEFNLTPPMEDPDELLAWKRWYLAVKRAGDSAVRLLEQRIKVQSSIGEFRDWKAQRPAANGEDLDPEKAARYKTMRGETMPKMPDDWMPDEPSEFIRAGRWATHIVEMKKQGVTL